MAGGGVPDLQIGWHAVDPGPPPRSALLDSPPVASTPADIVAAHQQWRRNVEQDEKRLATLHTQQPIWFPVGTGGDHRVIPVLGGTPAAWSMLVASIVIAADAAGFGRIRVANLLRWDVFDALRAVGATAKRSTLRLDTVSARGSSVDVFGLAAPDDLAGMVVDVLRIAADPQGRRDSAREKQDLLSVARLLDPPVTIDRLRDALDVALGQAAPATTAGFTAQERRALRDFHAGVVTQRRGTADRLDGLSADLRELASYALSPATPPTRLGSGPPRIRCFEVGSHGGIHEFELGREVLVRAVARSFSSPSAERELLIVAGAEKLAPEVLDNLTGTAERERKQLFLLFSEVSDTAERTLGHAGSGFAIFLRLPNSKDARVAAEHLGREFTFVVNGITISETQTQDWNESYSDTQSTTVTRSRNRSANSGTAGLAMSFGQSVGSSVSKGFTTGHTAQHGSSHGVQRGTTVSTGRVHDYVLEPEVFQQMDDEMMLIMRDKAVVLASCDYRIRRMPITSPVPLAIP